MRTRFYFNTTPFLSVYPVSPHLANRTSFPAALTALLVVFVLLLAACGPAESESKTSQAEADTLRIAQEYQANGDVDQARVALDGISVANPRQYLVLRAELSIAENQDPQATAALVKLAVNLGSASGVIQEYAAKNGLAAATPTYVPLAQVDPTATFVPNATSNAQPAALAADETLSVTGATTAITTTIAATSATTTSAALLALPTPTPLTGNTPMASATGVINVRNGPGTEYDIVSALQPADAVAIIGKNAAGDWWEVKLVGDQTGWVLDQLVQTSGDLGGVGTEANIPTPPPTPAPLAVATTPEPAQAAEVSAPIPAEGTATEATAPAASASDKPFFKVAAKRMWSKAENGACSGQHLLRINVIDAAGVRLNGVRLKGIYTGEIMVTGSQGKGDGVIEYDLYGTGEGFAVIQNNDGREADSEHAEGFTTKSLDIDVSTLIGGGYCTDEANCQIFYNSYGCTGHHSWETTFQRNY